MALFMCLLAASKAPAQSGAAAKLDEAQPLQIGDTIPEELWHLPLQVVNHPEGRETITLNDYRGKLIILDFWGTFCSSCIAAMPKIAKVQGQFADDMVVIPVSWSKPDATEQTLQNHATLAPLSLSSVVDAQLLIDAFPHGVVPHYAWIDPQGRVVATTATNDLYPENISRVLAGESPDYEFKTFMDLDAPILLANENLSERMEMRQYAIFIQGEVISLGSTTRFRREGELLHGVAYINRRLENIYRSVIGHLNPTKSNIYIEWVDERINDNYYTVDFILPPESSVNLYADLLEYLNTHSGYSGEWVKRRQICWVLVKSSENRDFVSKSAEKTRQLNGDTYMLKQFPISHLVARLESMPISTGKVVVNDTGYDSDVDVMLKAPFDDITHIRGQLNEQGLDLLEAERDIDIFEIRKND